MLDFILTNPGSIYGPAQRVEAGDYLLTLMCDGPGAAFALQALKDGLWEDIPTPELIPGPQAMEVSIPAGLVRLDVRGRFNVDIFACLHKV